MPQYKSPEALKMFCLRSMANNFNTVWCPEWESFRKIDDIAKFPPLTEPVANIPSSLVEDLIETMKEKTLLRRHHLHFLIRENLERITLTSGISDIYFAIEFICQRCQNLRHLSLSYQKHLPPDALLKLVQHIPLIQTLDLQNTSCMNQVLEVVGSNCKDLRSLNVRFCPITDYGIIGLCTDYREGGAPKCQKLVKLLVADTYVTVRGAAHAITHLPSLLEFDFADMFKVFDLISMEESYSHLMERHTTFNILHLRSKTDMLSMVTPEQLELTLSLCPKISMVCLENVDITNEGLLALAHLANLSELLLDMGGNEKVDFAHGILPLLELCGSTLTRLQLSKLDDVDVEAVGRVCPRVEDLSLLRLSSYQPSLASDPLVFSKLHQLEIKCKRNTDLPATVLMQLLMNCKKITKINLLRCDCLTGELIENVTSRNPLTKLADLYLEECDEISVDGIAILLCSENCLSYLRLWSCGSFTDVDYALLMEAVQCKNFDFNLDYVTGFLQY